MKVTIEIPAEFVERLTEIEARLMRIEELLRKANERKPHQENSPQQRVDKPSAKSGMLTIPQFAQQVQRNRQTVYGWIRTGKMPAGAVVMIQGSLRINWPVYQQSIRSLNGGGNGVEDVRWPDS